MTNQREWLSTRLDQLCSGHRLKRLSKTDEEQSTIYDIASSVGIASELIKDAHGFLGEYERVTRQIQELSPQILALIPSDLQASLNRLSAKSEAWRNHAESELFQERVTDFSAGQDSTGSDSVAEILEMASKRKEQEFAATEVPQLPDERTEAKNVVSIFKTK